MAGRNSKRAKIDRAATEKLLQTTSTCRWIHATPRNTMAFLIVRHGKLVLEEYFHGEHRDKLSQRTVRVKELRPSLDRGRRDAARRSVSNWPEPCMKSGTQAAFSGRPRPADSELSSMTSISNHVSGLFLADDTNDEGRSGNEDKMWEPRGGARFLPLHDGRPDGDAAR